MAAKKTKKVVKKVSQAEQIRTMENVEIEARILELKKELHNLRFQAAVGKLEKTAQLKKVKKEIARCYTIMTERANAN
ncbi:MAG: 50S ribosomal protein L29 [Bacilli bacterium]|nr:50S ribosomal protein L29 [Bacilli bacterium]